MPVRRLWAFSFRIALCIAFRAFFPSLVMRLEFALAISIHRLLYFLKPLSIENLKTASRLFRDKFWLDVGTVEDHNIVRQIEVYLEHIPQCSSKSAIYRCPGNIMSAHLHTNGNTGCGQSRDRNPKKKDVHFVAGGFHFCDQSGVV